MMIGSATRGVVKSSGLQVTTTSGIRDDPLTLTIAPSTSARQPVLRNAWASATWVLLLISVCALEPGAFRFGTPWMNSQTSGWRSCQGGTRRASSASRVAGAASRPALAPQ